jgi:hypothetical protein
MTYDAQQQHTTTSDPWGDLVFKLAIGMLLILGVPIILIGLVGSHQIQERFPDRQRLAWSLVVLLALVCLAIGYHFFWPIDRSGSAFMILVVDVGRGIHHGLQFNYWRLLHEILPIWAIELLLAPTAVIFCGVSDQARPKSPTRITREREQQRRVSLRRANKAAERALARKEIPDALTLRKDPPSIVLGAPIEGTLLDWIKNRLFCLPHEYLIHHVTVIGASGTGKSETLLRIAIAAARVLKWQVIYIDAKGDYKAAAKFLLAMRDAGITNVRLFPVDTYDGWRGSRDALLSKLLSIDNVAEVTSQGQHHYQTVRENLVEMSMNAPGGPPANSEELLKRLLVTNGVLYDLYNGYPDQQLYLETLLKRPQDALSAYGHYRAFFTKLHGKLDGDWSFDDCDAAYILLDGLALPEITDGIGRFLLADFVNYVTRKDWDKRVMFVFDEAGALKAPLYNIFERVRFRQVSVMVSSQDPSGLAHKPGGQGTWDEVKRILGNSAIKILHRCEDAHEVIRRAGTVKVPEEDYRTDASGTSTSGNTRFREELKIDHNEVLRLQSGECFIIGPGDYERVRVAMRSIDEARWRGLYKDLERKAKAEPPPMPRRHSSERVVDSSLASPPPGSGMSSKHKPGTSSSNKTNGKPSGGQKLQKEMPSPTSSPAAGQKQGKNGIPPTITPQPAQKQPGLPAAPSGKVEPNIDETLPFALPEVDPQAPTQPGVLPMWNEKEDEDLLH